LGARVAGGSQDDPPGSRSPCRPALDLVLLGPVGAGKGTQARRLAQAHGLLHLSSGDLLREQRRAGTPLGQEAAAYMERGELVPDALVIGMILERIGRPDAARGVLLDGFPRTLAQARALDAGLAGAGRRVGLVLYLVVAEAIIVERLAHRWTCPVDGATYDDRTNRPRVPGVCDNDGARLYQRDDDRPEVVRERLRVWQHETEPVVAYYRTRGLVREVDGARDIEAVAAELERIVEQAA
jgi:adenylate kinase